MKIFCANCGHQLKEEASFCEQCGTPVQSRHKSHDAPNPAEEKAWYRFLKVAYILLYAVSVGLLCIIALDVMPQRTIDGNLSKIKCENGINYAPERNDIYVYGDTLSSYQDHDARILCAYDTTNYYSYSAPSYKNYTFTPYYIEADYTSWFFYSAIALLVVWVLLKLLRVGVQYIVLGNRPDWKREFKKYY